MQEKLPILAKEKRREEEGFAVKCTCAMLGTG
jgi:hypothetical protein